MNAKRKLFVILTTVVTSVTAFAGTRTIYVDASFWEGGNAVFGVHVWGGEAAESYTLNPVSGSIYSADIRDDATYAIFLRKNPDEINPDNFWAGEWNRSTTSLSEDKNLYTITSWSSWNEETKSQDANEHGTWCSYRTIYLDARNWTPVPDEGDPAVFAVYVWEGDDLNRSYYFEQVDGAIFKADIRDDVSNAIFLRKNPADENVMTDIWAGVWNRAYSEIPVDKNRFTVTAWEGGEGENPCIGEWSNYPAELSYSIYVRNLTTWADFDLYAYGTPSEPFGPWHDRADQQEGYSTQQIDGALYHVYSYKIAENVTPSLTLIFNNNREEGNPENYRFDYSVSEARDYYFSVTNYEVYEGLTGVKRFRPFVPMDYVFGYQFNQDGQIGPDWPGAQLTPDAEGWYAFNVRKGATVIFNNGTGEGAMQTPDITYTDEHAVADECVVWQGATHVAGEPAITYMDVSYDCDAAVAALYSRPVTNGNYGTICLPFSAVSVEGATLYSIAGKDGADAVVIEEVAQLEQGVPYIFLANSDQLVVRYMDGQSFTPAQDHLYRHDGLVGFINDGNTFTVPQADNNFILYQNGLYSVNSVVTIASNRAYIDWDEIPSVMRAAAAPRKRIGVHTLPTAIGEIQPDQPDCRVMISGGMVVIVRDGKMYNTIGQIIK